MYVVEGEPFLEHNRNSPYVWLYAVNARYPYCINSITVSHVQGGHNALFSLQKYKQYLISLSSPGYVNGTMGDKAMTPLRIYIISTTGTVSSTCHDMGWDGKWTTLRNVFL